MDAALIAALPAYTAALLLAGRYYWSRRCAECAYRHTHTTGRHRATRPALPPAPPRAIAAPPPGPAPDATAPALPRHAHPSPPAGTWSVAGPSRK